MRILILVLLLSTSGAVWADRDIKRGYAIAGKNGITVNVRYDDSSSSHERKHKSHERKHKSHERKHNNHSHKNRGDHHRHNKTWKQTGHRYQKHGYWHGKRWVEQQYRNKKDFRRSGGYKDDARGYRSHAGHWFRADQFRTRRHHASDPVIHINARLDAIGLTGLKRDAYIHEAWVEFGNGAIKPLRELEGSLHGRQRASSYFKKPRYVRKLILRVESTRRSKRAYVGVDYLPAAGGKGGKGRRY